MKFIFCLLSTETVWVNPKQHLYEKKQQQQQQQQQQNPWKINRKYFHGARVAVVMLALLFSVFKTCMFLSPASNCNVHLKPEQVSQWHLCRTCCFAAVIFLVLFGGLCLHVCVYHSTYMHQCMYCHVRWCMTLYMCSYCIVLYAG